MQKGISKYFKTKEDVYKYINEHAHKYYSESEAYRKDPKFAVIKHLAKNNKISPTKYEGIFSVIKPLTKRFKTEADVLAWLTPKYHLSVGQMQGKYCAEFNMIRSLVNEGRIRSDILKPFDRLSNHFKTEDMAYAYFQKHAKKYNSFCDARLKDKIFDHLLSLVHDNRLDSERCYAYFGGRKSSSKTDRLCRYFKDQPELKSFLQTESKNHDSLFSAAKIDPRFAIIYGLIHRKKISREFVSENSQFKIPVLSGKFRSSSLLSLLPKKSKHNKSEETKAWITYLKKHANKYDSLRAFRLEDELGEALIYAIDPIKSKRLFTSSQITKKFWPHSLNDRREHKVMNSLENKLKRLKSVLKTEREVSLDRSSRIDIQVTLKNGRIVLIEGKHDTSAWKREKVSSQIDRYAKAGKKKYGNKYQKTILCSPNGTYGSSFDEVILLIKSL